MHECYFCCGKNIFRFVQLWRKWLRNNVSCFVYRWETDGSETMFLGLSTFGKHDWETMFPGLSTFGKHDWETMFPGLPLQFWETWL
jgi:hypothetical protein